MQSPLFSSALQNSLTAGSVSLQLHHGDLLFIQVCSGATPMHCSSVYGKMQSPLFTTTLKIRLSAGSVSLQLQLSRFAFHTGIKCLSTKALQLYSGQNAVLTVQCCSATHAHSRQCVIAVTPWRLALHTDVQ